MQYILKYIERDDDDQSRGSSRSVADSRDGEERPSTVDKESEIDPEAGKDNTLAIILLNIYHV